VYFTPPVLADRLIRPLGQPLPTPILDPACGAGDLLLRAAARRPVATHSGKTARSWDRSLAGVDLDPVFIRIARARLAILLRLRTAHPTESLDRSTTPSWRQAQATVAALPM
jgi:hypothetical protein